MWLKLIIAPQTLKARDPEEPHCLQALFKDFRWKVAFTLTLRQHPQEWHHLAFNSCQAIRDHVSLERCNSSQVQQQGCGRVALFDLKSKTAHNLRKRGVGERLLSNDGWVAEAAAATAAKQSSKSRKAAAATNQQ